ECCKAGRLAGMGTFMRAATRKKRQTVVETALALFAERGYEQVSVDDILQAANISKGTFYHYFSGKEQLLAELDAAQSEIAERWHKTPPALVPSLEDHVNRLFLD